MTSLPHCPHMGEFPLSDCVKMIIRLRVKLAQDLLFAYAKCGPKHLPTPDTNNNNGK